MSPEGADRERWLPKLKDQQRSRLANEPREVVAYLNFKRPRPGLLLSWRAWTTTLCWLFPVYEHTDMNTNFKS